MRTQKSLYPLQLVPLEAFLFFSFFMVLGMKPHHARVGAPPLSHAHNFFTLGGSEWVPFEVRKVMSPPSELVSFQM